MKTICGIECGGCNFKKNCKGCSETGGRPFGGECLVAECYKTGGKNCFTAYLRRLTDEFNALGISDMPEIKTLVPLYGAYVNLEYTLSNGEKIKLLDDTKIYLGNQVEKANGDRCYGLVADKDRLLVCEYEQAVQIPKLSYIKRDNKI